MPPTMVDMTEPSTPGTGRLLTLDEGSEFGARAARHLREDPVLWLTTVAPSGAPSPNPVWFLGTKRAPCRSSASRTPPGCGIWQPTRAWRFTSMAMVRAETSSCCPRPRQCALASLGEPGADRGCRVSDQVRPAHRTDRSDPEDLRPEVLRADRGDLDPAAGPLTRRHHSPPVLASAPGPLPGTCAGFCPASAHHSDAAPRTSTGVGVRPRRGRRAR